MIATITCVPRGIINQKRGTFRNGKEFHRVDMLVETNDYIDKWRTNSKMLVVQFMSGDGEKIRLPRVDVPIELTLSVTASNFNNKWMNNVCAMGFKEVTGEAASD
jgi:hypothetical protein